MCCSCFIEPLEDRRLLAVTYYVSASGNDNASGTSPATAWRSIARVNKVDLNGGDKVLFEGGKIFAVSGSTGSNVLTNAGFESDLSGWTETLGGSTANASIVSSGAHSGSKALRLSGSGAAVRAQDVTSKITANQTYFMSVWSKATSIGTGNRRVGVTFYLAGIQVATFYRGFKAPTWAETNWEFVAPPKFDKAIVWASRKGDSSSLYIDDLTLKSMPNGLVFTDQDSGTAANSVVIASYGSGKATIDAKDSIGLWAGNVAGFRVQNLNFRGSWNALQASGENAGVGIEFVNTRSDNSKLEFITVEKCDVRGFHWGGIRIGGWAGKSGFRLAYITDTIAAGNGDVGIMIRGEFDITSAGYSNEKVYIARCKTYVNAGIPDKWAHSGSGILVTDTIHSAIERCVSFGNGQLNNYDGGGPVGIWAFDASKIVIQYNESYNNHTGSSRDGAGFDFDGGVTNSIMQNNYSHDNDGPGYLLAQFVGHRTWANNFVRYNISQNDGRKNTYGALTLTGGPGPSNVAIENNVFYVTPAGGASPSGIRGKWAGNGVAIRNNIVQTTGGVTLADVDSSAANAQLNGNAWWSTGGAFKIRWSGMTHGSLQAWRSASGREMNGSSATGQNVDPKLTAPGAAPMLGDPYKLGTLTQYKLQSASPLINSAVTLAAPFASYFAATHDFFGKALPATKRDIGAAEA
jgi:hypothetical protein